MRVLQMLLIFLGSIAFVLETVPSIKNDAVAAKVRSASIRQR
eukprot:SAG31_NODE_4672_length_3044_cov_3.919525_5_plen_42_part_00